jgi:hypothetical protein
MTDFLKKNYTVDMTRGKQKNKKINFISTWRFHPVMCHAVQSGGKTENLDIARRNL